VTLLDPSFTRKEFVFIEGKSKAKLTYGTMKPGSWAYVDLDMTPRTSNSITLSKSKVTYNLPDETSSLTELFNDGDQLHFKTSRDYYVKNIEYIKILSGIVVLGILPILYSNHLKKKRIKSYKSN
jgi:Translocon-associated protein beta (TRAPB)